MNSQSTNLIEGGFEPGLMLPAYFVVNANWSVATCNETLTSIAAQIGCSSHFEREGSNSKKLYADKFDYGEKHDTRTSVWSSLFHSSAEKYIGELIRLAKEFRLATRNFNRLQPTERSLRSLEEALNKITTNVDNVEIYVNSQSRQSPYFIAGVKVVPLEEGSLKTLIPEESTMRTHRHVHIVAAFRISLVWQGKSLRRAEWYGMQPAFHDAISIKKRHKREKDRIWIQNISGINHWLGFGMNHIQHTLSFAQHLLNFVESDKLILNKLLQKIEADPELSSLVDRLRKRTEGSTIDQLNKATYAAHAINDQHLQFCDFLAFIGSKFADSTREEDKYLRPFDLESPQDLYEYGLQISRKILAIKSYTKPIDADLMNTPLILKAPDDWVPIRFKSESALMYLLFHYVENASKYSRLDEPFTLSASQISRDGEPLLEISVSNNLNIDLPEEHRLAHERCEDEKCLAPFQPGKIYQDSGNRIFLCQDCLYRRYYSELVDCHQFSIGRGGGKGLFMVKYLVEDIWKGKVFDADRITDNWDDNPRKIVEFGATIPCGEAWEKIS